MPSAETQKTHVVRKTLSPVWNKTLEFKGLKLGDVISRGCRLEVFDHDAFSRDDPLGELTVDLSALNEIDQWHYTEALPTQGTLEFTVSWTQQDARLVGAGTLTVRLVRGQNLKPADANGFSDPYVKLALGGTRHKSRVVKKCLSPVWDEAFDFKGTLGEITNNFLQLVLVAYSIPVNLFIFMAKKLEEKIMTC